MNWVGGARSRVKQQTERKVQKDYFERKRLINKVKRARPLSPGNGRSKKLISQDLLFLQISSAHATDRASIPEPVKQAQKVDLSKVTNFKMPSRDLELPMSPIGKPSSLEFLDASSASLSLYEEQTGPKVSTQKIPHRTILDSFGPPSLADKIHQLQSSDGAQGEVNSLCMTESVFPVAKKAKMQYSKHQDVTHPSKPSAPVLGKWQATDKKQRARNHYTWDKSLDHETPFDFGNRVVKKPKLLKPPPPQTKGSLLEFHHCQKDRDDHRINLEHTHNKIAADHHYQKVPVATKEERKPAQTMAAAIPRQEASEPTMSASFGWLSSKRSSSRSSSVSSLFDEDPLRQTGARNDSVHPYSASTTLFDESIIRPVKARQKQNSSHEAGYNSHSNMRNGPDPQGGKTLSTFEKMMMSLKGGGHSTAQGAASDLSFIDKGKDKPRNSSTHHAEWKHFITGAKAHEVVMEGPPLQQLHQEDEVVNSGPDPVSYGKGTHSVKNKPFPGLSTARRKNISVMEELLCLEEELTSSLESDILASQDLTLTPTMSTEDPLRCVPEITEAGDPVECDSDLSQEGEEEQNPGVCINFPVDVQIGESELQQLNKGHDHTVNSSCLAAEIPSHVPQSNKTVEQSTQTGHYYTKIYKEVACECDLWSEEPLQLKPLVNDASVQAIPSSCTEDATTQTSVSHLTERGIQTDAEWNTPNLSPSHSISAQTVNVYWSSESVVQAQVEDNCTQTDNKSRITVNVGTQTPPDERVSKLEKQVAQLKEELEAAQSTVVWQSLMIKLHKIETAL